MTPPYVIQSVREIPFATARRTEVAVIVEPGTTVEDAIAIAREVAKDRREGAGYSVLQVAFYDRPELVGPQGGPAPLGYWVHAPGGEWGRSLDARPGVYDDFEENPSRLRAADWSRRPSERQVRMHVAWFDNVRRLEQERGPADPAGGGLQRRDDEVTDIVADLFETDVAEVKAALMAVLVWTLW